ncbi:glycosyltransferase family 4 protein, partial [Patescibacteria group bacterium]|nr:glycosyltransferase family 4 protein [Patescibacteria group bacterium]
TYNWVKKIGQRLEKLYVITWQKSEQKSERGDLPKNIEIISLFGNKFLKIFILQFKLLKILPKVNGVFCHQNPEYTILSAFLAKLFRKKIISWYAHGYIGWKLHLVNWLADKILTSSDKGCRLKNRKKIEVIGQGIDIDYFNGQSKEDNQQGCFRILSLGRISPAKDYKTLINAIEILIKERNIKNIEVQIIGGPVLKKEQKYFDDLKKIIKEKNLEKYIEFLGPISHNQILSYYQSCDLFINLSQTGSMDKVVLEAMACKRLVLTCNEAFIDFLDDQRFIFEKKNPQDLAQKIINLINLPIDEKQVIGQQSRNKVVKNHNLDNLVNKIIQINLKLAKL